jgi:hypothetical protein
VWCAEFDRTDDGEGNLRRDVLPTRDLGNKRRGGKGVKEEKVCLSFLSLILSISETGLMVLDSSWKDI